MSSSNREVLAPYAPPAARGDARPAVIRWFRVYAGSLAVVYLVLGGAGIAAGSAALGVAGVLLALVHGGAAFVPFKPWGWTVALVILALGLASGAFLLALPLLVQWFKPLTKAAFARL